MNEFVRNKKLRQKRFSHLPLAGLRFKFIRVESWFNCEGSSFCHAMLLLLQSIYMIVIMMSWGWLWFLTCECVSENEQVWATVNCSTTAQIFTYSTSSASSYQLTISLSYQQWHAWYDHLMTIVIWYMNHTHIPFRHLHYIYEPLYFTTT